MKYLKTYEFYTGNAIDYSEGDIVVCVESIKSKFKIPKHPLEIGKKYKVLKIYQTKEDKFLKNNIIRVDVENVETGEISKGWATTRFKIELEFDADKYNM